MFVLTPNNINKAKLKEELKIFRLKLCFDWYFKDDDRFFRLFKCKFNPRNKDAAIEIYLSFLKRKLMNTEMTILL